MVLVAPYFLCLDAKKVTKKNQDNPKPSGRLSGQATPPTSKKVFRLRR
jgi:hypothetical protein